MANVHLVTGYAGSGHITAADDGELNSASFGNGFAVLNSGNNFAASAISNNTIRIQDGALIMHGRFVNFKDGVSYVDLTIENGTAGQKRNDLVVCRYTKDTSSGHEECDIVVVKGTPTSGTPTDPTVNSGSIYDGETTDFPLYRISIVGVNIGEITPLFTAKGSLQNQIDSLSSKANTLQGRLDKLPSSFYAENLQSFKSLYTNAVAHCRYSALLKQVQVEITVELGAQSLSGQKSIIVTLAGVTNAAYYSLDYAKGHTPPLTVSATVETSGAIKAVQAKAYVLKDTICVEFMENIPEGCTVCVSGSWFTA